MSQLDLAAVFTLLFVTLGPVKLLAPFSQATRDIDERLVKRLALLTFVVGTVAALAGGLVGQSVMHSWRLSSGAVTLAGALIFLLVGLRMVLEPYSTTADASPPPLPRKATRAAFDLAFPMVVTPYGLAAFISLLANSAEAERTIGIAAMLVAVMAMNLLAMLYIRRIMGTATVMILQILGTMLAVLQVALAVQFVLRGLRESGLID